MRMAKRGVQGAHQHEGDQIAPPLVDPHRAADDERHPEPDRRHRDGVAHVVDAAQVGAQRRDGHAVGQEALAGQDLGPVGRVGHHGAGHGAYITIISQVTQVRNTPVHPWQAPPLTARSVLASALLGMDPPELPVAQLVRLTGLFGINENRARVALSRMVAAGEATTDGSGRYRLAGHLAARQSRQSASRAGTTAPYEGSWWLAVVTTAGSTAEVRGARRRALTYARLAELREGVWMRPGNVAVRLPGSLDADVELMTARPDDPGTGRPAVGPRRLDRTGPPSCCAGLDTLEPDGPEALAPGFELSAAVLRHLQADPLLPAELLPGDWPGPILRATYDDWDARYRATLREWSRAR